MLSARVNDWCTLCQRVVLRLGFGLLVSASALLNAQVATPVRSAAAANASLSGTVLTDATERPLLNAEITIPKIGLRARTDSAGNFSLDGIPAGEYAVAIRLAGFESIFTTLTFTIAQKLEADFLLKDRVIQFAPMSELARLGNNPDLGKHTFDERRVNGLGKYVGQDGTVELGGTPTSEMIRAKVHALHTNTIGKGQQALASGEPSKTDSTFVRGDAGDAKAGAKLDCYVQVLLNASAVYRSKHNEKLFDVNSIPSRMVMSVEYYAANDTPARYSGAGSQCGTLVIWTRGR